MCLGNAEDLVKECDKFESAIKDAGGIELFIGGIGPDGHIGTFVTVLISPLLIVFMRIPKFCKKRYLA